MSNCRMDGKGGKSMQHVRIVNKRTRTERVVSALSKYPCGPCAFLVHTHNVDETVGEPTSHIQFITYVHMYFILYSCVYVYNIHWANNVLKFRIRKCSQAFHCYSVRFDCWPEEEKRGPTIEHGARARTLLVHYTSAQITHARTLSRCPCATQNLRKCDTHAHVVHAY